MILVTVGTHNKGFERLVRAADELGAEIKEPVIIQYGSSTYIPVHAENFQWTSSQQMQEYTRQARVIISHAAAGAIMVALLEHKPLIVVPRSKKFDEVMDNHQLQLSTALDEAGLAIGVTIPSVPAFMDALQRVTKLSHKEIGATQLIEALQNKLEAYDFMNSQEDGGQ